MEEARAEGLSAGITKPPALVWNDKKLEGYPSPEAWRSYFAFGADTDKT